jgi:DNA polymerase-3 subunit epsilon
MEQTTSKQSKGIAFFDLETTGVDVAKDRIVQIAVVRKDNDGTIEEKKVLVNPEIPIPKESTEVHGITDEMVKNAPRFKQIAKSLYDYIEGYDLSGYNILHFDLPLLVEELLRAGVEFSFDNVRYIDVMVIYKKLHPRDLSSCYNHYTGKILDGAHDALNDTRATADILDAMLQKEESISTLDNDGLDSMSRGDKPMVDFAGKFTRNEAGVICFNFGKHRGVPVTKELGFIDWMLGKDFTQDTLNWARKIKKGEVI